MRDCGALLEGHFLLSSGLHSPFYLQCARLLMEPRRAERVCAALHAKIRARAAGARVRRDRLAGARRRGARLRARPPVRDLPALFAERVEGRFALRRGFALAPGARVLIAEDVVTTGLSTRECMACVRAEGGAVVAAACLIDRSGGAAPARRAAGRAGRARAAGLSRRSPAARARRAARDQARQPSPAAGLTPGAPDESCGQAAWRACYSSLLKQRRRITRAPCFAVGIRSPSGGGCAAGSGRTSAGAGWASTWSSASPACPGRRTASPQASPAARRSRSPRSSACTRSLSVLLSFLVRGNYLAAVVGTLVGNPWTFPLIWLASYQLGHLLLGSAPSEIAPLEEPELTSRLARAQGVDLADDGRRRAARRARRAADLFPAGPHGRRLSGGAPAPPRAPSGGAPRQARHRPIRAPRRAPACRDLALVSAAALRLYAGARPERCRIAIS